MHRADGNLPIERGLLLKRADAPAEGGGASDAGATTPATRRRTNGPGDIGGVGGADGKTGTAIREYVLQNWRADVVSVVDVPGDTEEAPEALDHVRYSAYGVPVAGIHLAAEAALADRDADGDADLADLDDFLTDFNASDPSADIDGSGTVAVDDLLAYLGRFRAGSRYQNRGAIGLRSSPAAAALRHSYAGYLAEQDLDGMTHLVRHRWLLSELGQWNRRDPLGYVDGMGLRQYASSRPLLLRDPRGLASCSGGNGTKVPWIDQLPSDFVGPPTGQQSACDIACTSTGSTAVVTCYGGKPLTCWCTQNNSGLPGNNDTDFMGQLKDCMREHEEKNASIADCEGVEDGGAPNADPQDIPGNEADAYWGLVTCVNKVDCSHHASGSDGHCLCRASQIFYSHLYNCRAQWWEDVRQGRTPPSSFQDHDKDVCQPRANSIAMMYVQQNCPHLIPPAP